MGMAMMGTGKATGDDRAKKAAEDAIASPLLEDINFSGAKGVLVNITAGLDMSIGEFEEVGDVIKNFISDEATVVVGTVIDPEMSDELRVTVIVTGIGSQNISSNTVRFVEAAKKDGSLDYQQLDRPTVLRKQMASPKPTPAAGIPDVDYLDIPAFLRRQEEA